MESGMFTESEIGQGSRMALHRDGGVGDRAPRRGSLDFRLGRVPRSDAWTLRPRGHDGLGKRAAKDTGRTRAAVNDFQSQISRPTAAPLERFVSRFG